MALSGGAGVRQNHLGSIIHDGMHLKAEMTHVVLFGPANTVKYDVAFASVWLSPYYIPSSTLLYCFLIRSRVVEFRSINERSVDIANLAHLNMLIIVFCWISLKDIGYQA